EYRKLFIREPKEESVEKVRKASVESGDNLSQSDIEILALAIDLGGVLYTDDYGLQNVARKLSVPFKPVTSRGIREEFIRRLICKGCKKVYSIDYREDICEICGSPLERRIIKKRR
ncbi:MAG TPA: ribonuclease VapC, partial [Methanothermococcus okinawensis]|nr:ribonuclease VapC [Methanothermococcus okinawensis]